MRWWHSRTWLTRLELWSNIKAAFLCSKTCVFRYFGLVGFPSTKTLSWCLIITPNLPILKHRKTKTTVITFRITFKAILIMTNLCSFDQTDSMEDCGLSGLVFTSRLDWNKNKTALNVYTGSQYSRNVQPKLNRACSVAENYQEYSMVLPLGVVQSHQRLASDNQCSTSRSTELLVAEQKHGIPDSHFWNGLNLNTVPCFIPWPQWYFFCFVLLSLSPIL